MSNSWNQNDPVGEPVPPGTREQQAQGVNPTPAAPQWQPKVFSDFFSKAAELEAAYGMQPGEILATLGPAHLATVEYSARQSPFVARAKEMGLSDEQIVRLLQRREAGGRIRSAQELIGE